MGSRDPAIPAFCQQAREVGGTPSQMRRCLTSSEPGRESGPRLPTPLCQVLRGHVRGRCQRLRGPEGGGRGHLTLPGRGLGGLTLHVKRAQHRVCAHGHQVRRAGGRRARPGLSAGRGSLMPVYPATQGRPLFPRHVLQCLQVHGPVQPDAVHLCPDPLHGGCLRSAQHRAGPRGAGTRRCG